MAELLRHFDINNPLLVQLLERVKTSNTAIVQQFQAAKKGDLEQTYHGLVGEPAPCEISTHYERCSYRRSDSEGPLYMHNAPIDKLCDDAKAANQQVTHAH